MTFQVLTGSTLRQLVLTASPLLLLLCLRGLPSLAYVLFTRELSLLRKVLAATAFAPLLVVTTRVFGPALLYVALGLAYYCACASALYAAIPAIKAHRISHAALFWVSTVLFLVLPAVVLEHAVATTFLVFGFEAIFSIYSYCVEKAGRTSAAPRLRECLFFVFVDPTLVYVQRSQQSGPAKVDTRGLLRMFWGVAGLLFTSIVLARWRMDVHGVDELSLLRFDRLGAVGTFAIARFLHAYVQQSALAHFQIGLMRQLGYTTPESFRYPLLAASPADFWRRWNIFLGNWIRRYIYVPLTLHLGRVLGRSRPDWAKAAGVIVTFASVGFVHAGYQYIASFSVVPSWIGWFSFHGLLVVAWVLAARLGTVLGLNVQGPGFRHSLGLLGSRVCLLVALSFSTVYWGA